MHISLVVAASLETEAELANNQNAKSGLQNKSRICPTCSCTRISKNGHRKGKQNYICRHCGRQFVETHSPQEYTDAPKQQGWEIYLKGKGLRVLEQITI